ncbi:hypothetical protein PPAR_a2265 [Pseudoalteromonas paragorgicola KMM 3548]|nr:hypothetical protein [Pseudoalteromonas distincta KMM 3548]
MSKQSQQNYLSQYQMKIKNFNWPVYIIFYAVKCSSLLI